VHLGAKALHSSPPYIEMACTCSSVVCRDPQVCLVSHACSRLPDANSTCTRSGPCTCASAVRLGIAAETMQSTRRYRHPRRLNQQGACSRFVGGCQVRDRRPQYRLVASTETGGCGTDGSCTVALLHVCAIALQVGVSCLITASPLSVPPHPHHCTTCIITGSHLDPLPRVHNDCTDCYTPLGHFHHIVLMVRVMARE
jgi:hypothetical protein